jgi:hypothetical protein
MLSEPEERALSGIEAEVAARDPAFARQFNIRKRNREVLDVIAPWLGPALCVVAIPLTVVLLVASPWLGLVGVLLFLCGLVMSVAPVTRLAQRLATRVDRRRVR